MIVAIIRATIVNTRGRQNHLDCDDGMLQLSAETGLRGLKPIHERRGRSYTAQQL